MLDEAAEIPEELEPGADGDELTPDERLLDTIRDADGYRVARIADELADGFRALADIRRGISVFGSARTPPGHPEYELALRTAELLGRAGATIVTGGGPGIMEAANRGARAAGALSIGLTIDLPDVERVNAYLDRAVNFHYFFARKVVFVRYAVGFVIHPGGLGTLDELFELMTLIQTHRIHSPPVVLVGSRYWSPLLEWMRGTVLAGGKISPGDLDLVKICDDPAETVAALRSVL